MLSVFLLWQARLRLRQSVNIMIQALAAGTAKDIASMRQLINRSISLETFYPEDTDVWDTAYLHFKQVTMNH